MTVLDFVHPSLAAPNVAFSSVTLLFLHSLLPHCQLTFPPSTLIIFALPFCKVWKISFQRSHLTSSSFGTLGNNLQIFPLIFLRDSSDVCSWSAFLHGFLSLSLFSLSTHESYVKSIYIYDSHLNAACSVCICYRIRQSDRVERRCWEGRDGELGIPQDELRCILWTAAHLPLTSAERMFHCRLWYWGGRGVSWRILSLSLSMCYWLSCVPSCLPTPIPKIQRLKS